MTEKEMSQKLQRMISESRYKHSLSVQKLAKELASIRGCNLKKASIAGLLHDCAKGMSDAELFEASKRYHIELDEIEVQFKGALLHPLIGARLASEIFGVDDPEILNAIRNHTTGSPNMSTLDKIIYICDYSEPTRQYNDAQTERIRELAYKDLNLATLEAMDQKIIYLIQKGYLIHPRTVAARNSVLKEIKVSCAIKPFFKEKR